MANKESIKVLLDIIKTEMELDDDRVLVYNQKWTLPNEKDIFVYLSYVSESPFMIKRFYEDRVDGFYEVQVLSNSQVIGIDIFSRDSSARTRKEEVLFALNSTYAQQQCEIESIKIASLPTSFNDISDVEASARLNRYNLSMRVISSKTKEKIVDYFENFNLETYRSL